MIFNDPVYGQTEINEPVLLEIIGSPWLKRLKYIDQAGYRPLWYKPETAVNDYDHSRLAHSLGVCLLLRRYGASLEEQIAGLIHDLSHSAFSHCIDYVLAAGSPTEHNHQDRLFKSYVDKTDIPAIIKKYGFNPDYILDEKNFPLLERELPDLCADRLDYLFKTAVIFKELSDRGKDRLLNNLITKDNRWLFKNYSGAKKYARLFLKLNRLYYAGPASAIMFQTVGDCLKHALDKRYISQNDLYATDAEVTEKIKTQLNRDEQLRLLWRRMNNPVKISHNPGNYDAEVWCKSRIVDPLFSDQGEITRLSDKEPAWADWRLQSYAVPFACDQADWYLYQIERPELEVGGFYGGPFRSWIRRHYGGLKGKKFHELALEPGVCANRTIQEMIVSFPCDQIIICLIVDGKNYVIEGMHRSCALAIMARRGLLSPPSLLFAVGESKLKELPVVGRELANNGGLI